MDTPKIRTPSPNRPSDLICQRRSEVFGLEVLDMFGQIARGDQCFTDQTVKVAGEHLHPFRIAKREVVLAEVNHRQKWAENCDWC